MERGLSHAGSSGLTSDRYGDSEPWSPVVKEEVQHAAVPNVQQGVGEEEKEEAPAA